MRVTLTVQSIVLVMSLLMSTSSSAQSGSIATEAFFDGSAAEQMKISPDGKHLAFDISDDERGILIVLRLVDREVVARLETATDRKIGEFYWVNEERIIFSPIVFLAGYDSPSITGELFALNIDNSSKIQLTGYGVGDAAVFTVSDLVPDDRRRVRVIRQAFGRPPISLNPLAPNDRRRLIVNRWKGPGFTFSSSRPESFLLDVYKKPNQPLRGRANLIRQVASPLSSGSLYTDNLGEVRLAASNIELEFAEVRVRNKSGAQWLDISDELSIREGQPLENFTFAGFEPNDERFNYLASGDNGRNSIFRYDIASRSKDLIFQDDEFDAYSSDLVYSQKDNRLIGVKLMGDFLDSYYFEESEEVDLRKRLDATFPEERVELNSVSQDGSVAIIKVTGTQRVGDFYVLDTASMLMDPALQGSIDLPVEKMAEVFPFAVQASDGLMIHGYVTRPQNTDKPLPAIILPNARPFGVRGYPGFDREAQFFAHHGYAVVQVNYRGSGGYGKAFEQAGYQQWGRAILEDIDLAARWAVQEGIAAGEAMCIFGNGFGAYAALASVASTPNRYQCSAGSAGFYDLTKMDRSELSSQPGGARYIATVIGTDEAELRSQSPVYNADKITVPVFIAHGGKDARAPLFHANDLRAALDEAGVTYEWLLEADEGHGFYRPDNRVNLYNRLLAFFDKHLKK